MIYDPKELEQMVKTIKNSKASPKNEGGATKTTPKMDMAELVRGAKIGAQKLREEEQKRLEEEAKAQKTMDDLNRTMAEGRSNIMQTMAQRQEGADALSYNAQRSYPTVEDRIERAAAVSMGMSPEEYEEAKFNKFRSARRYAESAAKQEKLAKDMLSSDVISQFGSPQMHIDVGDIMYYKDVADAAYDINKGFGVPYFLENPYESRFGTFHVGIDNEGAKALNDEIRERGAKLKGENQRQEFRTGLIAERAAQEAQKLAEKYTKGEPYVNLNGTMYSQYDLANYFFGQIMEVSHSQRIATDTGYQDYLFFQEHGMTRQDVMRQRVAEIRNELKALQHQAGEDAYRDKKHEVEHYLASGEGGLEPIFRIPRLEALTAEELAEKPYDDLLEQLNAWEQNDFSSSFAAAFDWANVFSLGMADVIVGGNINNALENASKGYYLSDSEKALVKMVQLTQELQSYRDKLYAPQSIWSMIGEGLGGTAEVLPEFALGMIATGGIGAGVKYGAGQAAKRYLANKTIANAARVAGHGALDLAKWTVGNYARGMAAAPMTSMFYEGVLKGYNSQYHFEGDKLVYTPKNKATIWAGAYIDTVNEFASEGMGATIGDVVGLGLKGAGRMMGITKKANKSVTGATTRKFLQAPMKESTKKLLKDLGYGGSLTGELTGEMLGDFMSQWQRYMVGADYDFEHFKDFDSWLTTIGVSAIMGGTMTTLGGGMNIYQETKYAKDIAQNRERIINNKIQDAALRDKLRMLSEVDDPMLAASELADYFNTHNIENASDKAYALDYITLNSQLKVLMGDVQEQERMVKFEAKRAEIEGKAYHGADGKSTRNVITVRDTEGNAYYVLKGDMANKEAMLELMDVNTGEMTTKVASAVTKPETASVDSLLINAYGNMFSLEEEVSRVKDVTGALSSVEKPTMEHVEATAMQLDITLPKKGDVVTMVDGRTAEITEDLGDGTYIAQRKASLTGLSETITLPFDAIRSNDSLTAKAQEAILNSGVESAVDATSTSQPTAEVQTPVESTTPQPTTQTPSGVSVGAVIVAPNGEQARVVEVNDDGTVTLNYNLNEGASMADAAIEVVRMEDLTKADGSDASANVPTTAQTEMPAPAVPAPVVETPTTDAVDAVQNVEVVPTQQDGTVDFDAIEDPVQCAQMMAAMLGGPENALAIVEESIEAVKAEMDKAVKTKAPTINEGVAKQNKINEIKTRLIRYEQIAFELEQMMKPAEAKSEAKAESVEHEAGLVENEHTAGLPEGMRKSIDEMAKRAKVRIVFVDERIKGDAEQKGNLIRVSTRNRTKAVEVLVGHELLHYMKSKMPEAYKAFKEAVIAFIGKDKFAKEVERRKKAYAAQNIKLDDEGAAEEIVADYAGYLVQGRDVFEKFIEPKKSDNVFLRGLKRGLEYIRNIFGANGMTKQVKAVDNMVDALNTLINATVEGKDIEKREETSAETTKNEEITAEEAKGEDDKTSHSLKIEMEEAVSRIADNFGEVDIKRGDVKYALRDVLPETEVEQAVQDLMRVTGRSRGTVERYLKAEQSLAKFILSGDNVAYLDYEADDSVPSIWENSDYPQGTVEFSNICRKRLPLTMIYQKLQKEFPNTKFNKTQLETIRQTLIANGIDVACGLCFVEDRRQHNDEIGQGFIDALSGKDVYVNANQQKAIDKLRESGDNYIPNLYELLTLDGMKKLRMEHPDVANAFIKYNNARGQQAGRLFQAYSAYHREILKFNNARVKKTNDVGGLRIFSFSDFEAHHLIDLVQVLTDCARKGIKVQGYTKVPEFALAVKDTNMKLNRSLIAKDNGVVEADYSPKTGEAVSPNVIDGKRLLLDTVEGIDVTDKNFFDSSASKNVGNILVGVNDEQIRIAMLDPFVDYIIPFHTGLSADILKQKGISDWKNYKYEQIEKTIVDGKMVNAKTHVNIYTDVLSDDRKTEKQFVERYLEVCKEKNLVPKFARFLNRDKAGNFVYAKGYYKFLLDFKMFDAKGRILPQEVVQPIFNDEVNKQILDDYVKGEKEQSPNEEVYEEVKEALGLGEKTKFSLASDVASILEEYDTEGVKYGSIIDVADGIEGLISESTEDTTELENILNDFRAAQDDARRWGNRMDSGGEEEFEEALRAYANKATLEDKSKSVQTLAEREVSNVVLEDTSDLKLPSSKEEAFEYIPQGGISIFNGDIDANIKVGRKAVKHTALHHQKDEYAIFAGIQQIVANAVKVGNIPVAEDEIGHTHSVSIMYVPINVNGTQYSARLLVKELENKGVVLEELSLYNVSMHKERGSAIQPLNASDEVGGITAKPQSFYKVKELIHNSQEIDKKILGINEVTRFSLITPEMDASYLDAVERGDMEAAQRMVMEAAKLAMPNTKVVDEDGNPKVVWHGTGSEFYTFRKTNDINELGAGYYFTDSYEMAERYATDETLADNRFRAEALAFDIFTDEMGHSEEDYEDIEFEDDYNKAYDLAVERMFGNGHVKSVFLNIEKPRILSRESSDFDPVYQYGFNLHKEGAMAQRYNDGIIDELFSERHEGLTGNQYVTFAPNQIKSADPVNYDDNGNIIPLSERFNPEKEDIRYSLIGEKGAAMLDQADESMRRLEDLETARQMERAGKKAKDIKRATGWERGADNLWRYEVDDYFEMFDSQGDINGEKKGDSGELQDYLDHAELYNAYPELRKIKVEVVEPSKIEGYNGLYYKDANKIVLARRPHEGMVRTLFHEVQHAIQAIEGFAEGGNPNMTDPIKSNNILHRIEKLQKEVEAKEKARNDLMEQRDAVSDKMAAWFDAHEDVTMVSEWDNEMRSYDREYNKLRKQVATVQREIDKANNTIAALEKRDPKLGKDGYRRLAGEVEARSTAARVGMIWAERLESLASEMEDIAPKDQIFLKDGIAYATEAAEEATRYSLPDIPFFDAEGNAIDMSAISETKALEMIDGRVRDMMEYDYNKSVVDIAKRANEDRRATRAYYAEERRKRRGGNDAPRTNVAKIDELFADTNINSLPLEVQALIFIAEGRAKIRWADKDGKRGLASELGLANSASDKAAMKSVWSGAEQSFDEVVHGWWESINGYERGIDTQDLRNALIEALMSFPSAKAAMRELQTQYDAIAKAEREALEEIDRREAADLDRVKREYEERSARFEMSEGEERESMREMAVEHYSSQPLSAADEALEELTGKLNKMERRAERLMLERKSGYRELAESIEKSKEVIIRTLEHLRMFSGMEQIHIDEVAKLIAMTRVARSKRQVEAVATKAKNLIQRIAIRKARENMRRLLDLKLSNVEVIQQILKESNTLPREERDALLKSLWKVSRNGWRATKAVHPDTKEIFKELNDLIKEYKKSTKDKEVATIEKAITNRLKEVEAELHPDVDVDINGNVKDNAGLPVDFNDNNKNIALLLFKSYLEVEAKNVAYSEANKTLRETDKGSENFGEALSNMYASREDYLSALKMFNATLEDVIVNGKDKLRDFNIEKEKHEIALRSMAIKAIGGKKASAQGKRANALQWVRAGIIAPFNSPYWTFETVLERIDRLSPYKKGEFYNYFMRKYTDANAKLYTSYSAHMESIGNAMARCFPDMAKQFGIIGRNPYEIYKAVMRKAEATALGTLKYKEKGVDREMQLTIANAMYIVAMWRQPRYREAMEANGITEGAINNLMQSINKEHAGYINFMDWVNTALLPNTRLEYDEVYRKLNGGSLAKEENYFPAKVVTHEDVKLDENGKGQLPSSPSALKERISHNTMPQMGTDYFKVLEAHIQDMDKWAAFAELTADLNVILSSDEFRRRLNEFMPGVGGDGGGKGSLYKMLYDTALIATGNYHYSKLENAAAPIQKAWATSNIAFRLWTAVKQISSVSVGITEHVYFGKHMLAASTVAGIAYEWKRAMALSPSLRYRWQSKAAGMEALMRETSRGDGYAHYRGGVVKTYDAVKDMADKAVKLGMTPNALVDAIACSILVNSVYDKAIHDMTKGKREATEEERKAAIRKAEIAFNSTQQSSEGAYLSAAQANPLYAPLTTYMNASFALHRKRMSGIHELWKLMTSKEYRRFLKDEYGVDAAKISAKDAFADIIRGIVGDLSFAAMGWGLMEVMSAVYEWLGGDGDDDDIEAEKQAFFETYWLPVFNGFLGGSQITSLFQGYDTSMTPAYDELLEDISGIFDDKGDWRVEVAQAATKYGLGIDIKSLYRIGAGLENMVAEEDGENAGSILMFLNAPNKYIKAFVGDRREGETLQQYQTRIMRLYTLFDKVMYEELYDENGKYIGEGAPSMIMSQTQAKALNKEYEAAYLKDVVVRNGGWDEYRSMMSTEVLYKDICAFIGVTPDAQPSKAKLRNTVYSTGEYVAPVYGLSQKEHGELLSAESYVAGAHYYRTRWVGDDEGYYGLLKEEYRKKSELIDKYNEYIK